jgi:hypothetical protein
MARKDLGEKQATFGSEELNFEGQIGLRETEVRGLKNGCHEACDEQDIRSPGAKFVERRKAIGGIGVTGSRGAGFTL